VVRYALHGAARVNSPLARDGRPPLPRFYGRELLAHVRLPLRHHRALVLPRKHLLHEARSQRRESLLQPGQRLDDGRSRPRPPIPPETSSLRGRFETHFKEIAAKVLTCQQPDGLWRASLLDPASFPLQEVSGSGLCTYALAWGVNTYALAWGINTYAFAWGVNTDLLDRATYAPALRKAWSALVGCVVPGGKRTYVQPIGADPPPPPPTPRKAAA
jgi:hypothetical protein